MHDNNTFVTRQAGKSAHSISNINFGIQNHKLKKQK